MMIDKGILAVGCNERDWPTDTLLLLLTHGPRSNAGLILFGPRAFSNLDPKDADTFVRGCRIVAAPIRRGSRIVVTPLGSLIAWLPLGGLA